MVRKFLATGFALASYQILLGGFLLVGEEVIQRGFQSVPFVWGLRIVWGGGALLISALLWTELTPWIARLGFASRPAPQLLQKIVQDLFHQAHFRLPQVRVISSPQPNLLVAGGGLGWTRAQVLITDTAVRALTTQNRQALAPEEVLRTIGAHELMHVIRFHSFKRLLGIVVGGLALLLVSGFFFHGISVTLLTLFQTSSSVRSILVLTSTLASLVFGLTGCGLLSAWLSRSQELEADRLAADYFGLSKKQFQAAFHCLNPKASKEDEVRGLKKLFLSHPSTEARLAALK